MDEDEAEEGVPEKSKPSQNDRALEKEKVYYVLSRTPHNMTLGEDGGQGYKYTLVEVSMLTAQKLMDLQEQIEKTEKNIEEMTKKW